MTGSHTSRTRGSAAAFPAISGPIPEGSPTVIAKMLEFCARHGIEPMVEEFAMSEVNQAMDRLRAGNAHYRIVLKNDF